MSVSADPYNHAVRRHFANPAHAGDLQEGYPRAVTAEVSGSEAGSKVLLAARIDGDTIACIRYRVFGCPHLIAAAEELCRRLEGAPVDALQDVPVAQLMEVLEVPVEKTGRLLLLEDAALALHESISATAASGRGNIAEQGQSKE